MATGRPALAALGMVGEELLLSCVAGEAAGPYLGLRGSLPLLRSLRRCFLALTQAELAPGTLQRMAERLGAQEPDSAARIRELARLYHRYRSLLAASQAKLDSGLSFLRRIQALSPGGDGGRGLQAALRPLGLSLHATAEGLQIGGLHRLPSWDALPNQHVALQVLTQLFPADAPLGASLCLPQLPEGDGEPVAPALDQGLKPLLESLYARHQLGVELQWQALGPALRDGGDESAWGRFIRGLFRPASTPPLVAADELPGETLTIAALPSPAAEARVCALRVRDLIDAGTPPGEIGIVVENPARRARVARALRRYGVPISQPLESRSFADCARAELPPPLSLPLQIYELLQQGLPREGLLAVMTSPYLRLPLPEDAADAGALARALRGAGVRALAGSPQEELRRRIREWLRLHSGKRGHGRDAPDLADVGEDPVELRQLTLLLTELSDLPQHGPTRLHAGALARLCERFALGARAQGFDDAIGEDGGDGGLATDDRAAFTVSALARDQAAVAVLRRVLAELPLAADALRLSEHGLSRQAFATLLRALFQRLWADSLRQMGQSSSAGAVQLAGLLDLPVQERRQLFCLGMIEGELPAGVAEDPLLSDDERALCNRFLGVAVLPLSRARLDAAPLRFVELLAHSAAAQLSYPRADEEGRPLLPSSFVATVLHAAGRDGQAGDRAPNPGSDLYLSDRQPPASAARHPSELWRFAAPAFARPDGGAGLARAVAGSLGRIDRARRSRLLSRLAIERARTAWFVALAGAGEGDAEVFATPAGPHSGQLSDRRLIAELASRLPGDARRPLSASALEDYARCPFRFFVYRVLHAAPIEEGSDDLDPLTSGRLHHRVLEKFFAERRDRGALPLRGDADEREHLLSVIDQVLIEFDERERTGHPTLFRARLRRLRSDLLRLIAREAQTPIEPGLQPTLLEHPFGPLRIAAQSDAESTAETAGDDALHIAGIIDRIDIGPGRALVLDYKTGQIKRYQDYLRTELLRTSFQLPLYAAAVQADPQVAARAGLGGEGASDRLQVSARYYAVRQATVSAPLSDGGLFALAGPARTAAAEHNVAEVAYRLWRRLRDGDFRVAPKTCEGCGLESVCRIGSASVDRLLDAADSVESESSSSVSGSGRSSRQSTGWASAQTPAAGSGLTDADGD